MTDGPATRPAGARSLLAALFLASRPISWINTAYPFAAAYLLTVGAVDLALVVGTVFFLVPYNLMLYGVNDVFDYSSDLHNPRKGGVQGALVAPERHRAVLVAAGACVLPFAVVLVALGGPGSWVVLGLVLLAAAAYSVPGLRLKEVPFLDSMTSSAHFTGPAVYGVALADQGISRATALVLAAFFLWGMASHAFGAVQDIVPDRAAGLSSIATVLGARRTVRAALLAWTASGALVLALPWPGPLAALVVVPYLLAAAPFVNLSDPDSARSTRGWTHFLVINYVCGFAITMLLILARP